MLFEGVLWLLLNHEQWSSLPAAYGPKSTCHARFREWIESGALARVWPTVVEMSPGLAEIHWQELFAGTSSAETANRRGPVAIRRIGAATAGSTSATHAA
jgi:transposase